MNWIYLGTLNGAEVSCKLEYSCIDFAIYFDILNQEEKPFYLVKALKYQEVGLVMKDFFTPTSIGEEDSRKKLIEANAINSLSGFILGKKAEMLDIKKQFALSGAIWAQMGELAKNSVAFAKGPVSSPKAAVIHYRHRCCSYDAELAITGDKPSARKKYHGDLILILDVIEDRRDQLLSCRATRYWNENFSAWQKLANADIPAIKLEAQKGINEL